MTVKILIVVTGLFVAGIEARADDAVRINRDAIPEHITTEDTRVRLSPAEQLILRQADFIVKDIRIGGRPVPSPLQSHIEHRRMQQLKANPKQNRPLSDCIKPENVIDQDVQDCINGLRNPHWR